MGIEQLPTNREILRLNQALPDDLRQCSVVLQFAKPMPKFRTEAFYRIRLTRGMLESGENEFWKPELMQPLAVGQQRCLACGSAMKRVGVMSSMCVHPICSNSGMTTITGPKRGVHSVKTEFNAIDQKMKSSVNVSFVVGREWTTVSDDVWVSIGAHKLKQKGFGIPFDYAYLTDAIRTYLKWEFNKVPVDIVSGCLLVLDRRYSELCLVAVYRTAGMLCDDMGVKLKS